MKLATNQTSEVFGDISNATEVSIKMDAFAFEALSGRNLYKNLPRAIVRELACNAYDAHVMAGTTDKPFSVHLPTELEPFFAIRDFGIGLDDAGVRKTYLTYFDSTKRNDNTVVGAWGLGSKSPLGYTDNFMITAYKDGVARTYTVFKHPQTGIPAVSMLSETETTEPNGLNVQMPIISRNDYNTFSREAASVLRWFPVAPTINTDLKLESSEYIMKDVVKGVHVVKNEYGGKVSAIQGFIKYPVNVPDREAIAEDVRDLLGFGLEMHFELGELQFSMSREELSYSEHTLRNIEKKLREVKAGLVPRLEAMMQGGDSDWNKACMLDELSRDHYNILKVTAQEFIDSGKCIVHKNLSSRKLGFEDGIGNTFLAKDGINIKMFHVNDRYSRRNKVSSVQLGAFHVRNKEVKDKKGVTIAHDTGYELSPTKRIAFVANDLGKNCSGYIREWLATDAVKNKKFSAVCVFDSEIKRNKLGAVEIGAVQHLLSLIGSPELVMASTMPSPAKRQNTTHSGVKAGDILVLDYNSKSEGVWRGNTDTIPTTTKMYVLLDNKAIVGDELYNDVSANAMREIFTNLKKHKFIDESVKLYGIRKGAKAEVESDKSWVKLTVALKEKLAKVDMAKAIEQAQANSMDSFFVDMVDTAKQIASEKEFDLIGKLSKAKKGESRLYDALVQAKLVKELDTELKIVSNMETAIWTKFPMLRIVKDQYSWRRKEQDKECTNYVKLVQEASKHTPTTK